jgi:hypothetical protein
MNTQQIEIIRSAAQMRWLHSRQLLDAMNSILIMASIEEHDARQSCNEIDKILKSLDSNSSEAEFKNCLKLSSAHQAGYDHGASGEEAQPSNFSQSPAEYRAYIAGYNEGEESITEFGTLEYQQ